MDQQFASLRNLHIFDVDTWGLEKFIYVLNKFLAWNQNLIMIFAPVTKMNIPI